MISSRIDKQEGQCFKKQYLSYSQLSLKVYPKTKMYI